MKTMNWAVETVKFFGVTSFCQHGRGLISPRPKPAKYEFRGGQVPVKGAVRTGPFAAGAFHRKFRACVFACGTEDSTP